MHTVRKVTENIYYLGGNDRRLSLFENLYPIPNGVSYNSYLVKDEKNVLLDTVDHAIAPIFIENLEYALNDKKLDYIIVNHMEPDHCATLETVVQMHPEAKIIGNAKTLGMIKQFFTFDADSIFITVKEGEEISTGEHTFSFISAPFVHWPEVMVTYEKKSKTLFSADAFGTFGALSGHIFADEVDFEHTLLDEARRYYTNIVGKYGNQVNALLTKAANLDIERICPLHGPIWRENLTFIIEKYKTWATYAPENKGVVIAYASIYGNTENAAEAVAGRLADKGIDNISVFDVSKTDASYILAEAFKYSHIILACVTYNADLFIKTETLISEIKAHNLSGRTFAFIENGTWGPVAAKKMTDSLSELKNTTILDKKLTIKSALKSDNEAAIEEFVQSVADSINEC